MFRKSRKAEQTLEAQKEVQERKSRFQIVKLEERVAPRCFFNSNAGSPRGGGYYYGSGKGKYVGNC